MSKHPDSQLAPLQVLNLAQLGKGDDATVIGLVDTPESEQSALRTRLLELGFAPGERVRIVAVSFPGGDPMAVRVGNTTFALRRREAAMIHVMHAA